MRTPGWVHLVCPQVPTLKVLPPVHLPACVIPTLKPLLWVHLVGPQVPILKILSQAHLRGPQPQVAFLVRGVNTPKDGTKRMWSYSLPVTQKWNTSLGKVKTQNERCLQELPSVLINSLTLRWWLGIKLESTFKKVEDHNKKTGNNNKTRKYYDEIQGCIGSDPNIKPVISLGSGHVSADDSSGDESGELPSADGKPN